MLKLLSYVAGAAALSFGLLASAPQASSHTVEKTLRLVFDIPMNHPRVPYFLAMAAQVARDTSGQIKIDPNPGGKIHPGFASVEALKNGDADLTFVNASNLERLDPRFGFINLPFTIDDTMMAKAETRDGIVDLLDSLARPQGLRVIGLMRGADQLLVFRDRTVNAVADLKGLRIRVAGAGIYQDIMNGLGAEPIVLPIPELKPSFARGTLDGVFTSPGAWLSQLDMAAPRATHAPGLMMITYVLVVRTEALDSLEPSGRQALLDAARLEISDNWERMNADDAAIMKQMAGKGAVLTTIQDTAPWRAAVAPVVTGYAQRHSQTWAEFQRRLHAR
ncbi:TRAP transporter substrate-binding protein [Inquilinus sp. OTU3971]|uniref:TRAP transporter substrate-binding protein n=1 Tax=Inquilinus sp. OTU3971 TaxID=3043855 RepID=UPI00313E713C